MKDVFGNVIKQNLVISVSGGRTSMYMLYHLWFLWSERENWKMIAVFANTGKEAAGTLLFVQQCSMRWGIPIVWVEGYPSNKGKGWSIVPKIVDFGTASTNGVPFEAMIKRLGIPSTNAPFCSDQLKRKVIEAYLKSIGWKKYWKAIGIRSDEIDRVKENYKKKRIIYPLLSDGWTKKMVVEWWEKQDFDLQIPLGLGNCDNCWKKDIKTLCGNARTHPSTFDWWKKMSLNYGDFNPRKTPLKPPFNFFRGNLSPWDIMELSKLPDHKITAKAITERLDGCSESCEAF